MCGVAADPHDEVPVVLWLLLRLLEHCRVHHVELDLGAVSLEVALYKGPEILRGDFRSREAHVEVRAVVNAPQGEFGYRVGYGGGTGRGVPRGGRQAVSEHVPGGASVRGGGREGAHGNVEPDREDPGPVRSAPEVPVLCQLVAEVVQHGYAHGVHVVHVISILGDLLEEIVLLVFCVPPVVRKPRDELVEGGHPVFKNRLLDGVQAVHGVGKPHQLNTRGVVDRSSPGQVEALRQRALDHGRGEGGGDLLGDGLIQCGHAPRHLTQEVGHLGRVSLPDVVKGLKHGGISGLDTGGSAEDVIHAVVQGQLQALYAAELDRKGGAEGLALGVRLQTSHHPVVPGVREVVSSLDQARDDRIVVEEVKQHPLLCACNGFPDEIHRRFLAQPHAEVGLRGPYVCKGVQAEETHLAGGVLAVRPESPDRHVLRGLPFCTLSARDEGLLEHVPYLVGLQEEQGQEFPGLLSGDPFACPVCVIVGMEALVDPSEGDRVASGFDLGNQVDEVHALDRLVERFRRVLRDAAADPFDLLQLLPSNRILLASRHGFGLVRIPVSKPYGPFEGTDNGLVEKPLLSGPFLCREALPAALGLLDDSPETLLQYPRMIHREMADTIRNLQHHREDELLHVLGHVRGKELCKTVFNRLALPEGEDFLLDFPLLLLTDQGLLEGPRIEAIGVFLDPLMLVLREERCALEPGSAASYDQLVLPDDDGDVVEDIRKGQAHACQGMLVPVRCHRSGEETSPLDANLLRGVDDALPEALHSGSHGSATGGLSSQHETLLSAQ